MRLCHNTLKGYLQLLDLKHKPLHDVWLASRSCSNQHRLLAPGAQRPFSIHNIKLAYAIVTRCAFQFAALLWNLHPLRVLLMVALDLFRGVFPAFRGYSQALIIDELQTLISSGNYTWERLVRLLLVELGRVLVESLIDTFATTNENIVQNSARYVMEYKQMEQRVRMDIPALSDPVVRDLFHESDLFVRSCSGVSSFGLLSPFDFIRILSLVSELASHALVLYALSRTGGHRWLLAFSIISTVLPLLLPWMGHHRAYFNDFHIHQEARTAAKQERMRALAHSDPYRPEVILFGLGPWILQSWANARRRMLGIEHAQSMADMKLSSIFLSGVNIPGILTSLQNIPLVIALQSSSASLGSLSLYRNSVQCFLFAARNLVTTVQMAFQSIFLLGAFSAAMEMEPRMQPKKGFALPYRSLPKGMKLEARNLSYHYPGSKTPALSHVNFTLEAGETLAIVGLNGSGKSTLANILLRIAEFDGGELLVNDVDIRRYHPTEYHQHVTAVFQGFSKFNASVKENIGVGYVPDIGHHAAIERAADLAGAAGIVCSLPKGLKTTLDSGFDPTTATAAPGATGPINTGSHDGCGGYHPRTRHGLSGGEWQRIAISRAFMRAHRPEVQLLVFDEPTSSLDAHAQNRVFDTVEKLSRSGSGGPGAIGTGGRTKTVVFITHRLSTARRADKIAMMEHGTITEFGTHQELLQRNGSYAALYRASV
ncbi:P-loop containing nucleoside triphosphate hydrolase protein [Cristinia sonorae]|uniref:P-loop containing nucleoside triphosphate hydrolase protein n=1 Tax=Cristinia sonorae TaxID=1940300 RepID=A0A8K0XU24_9AGAR|nr:P-loop containing nucleoside triphosphate hydrolase protein [Cristinia sonorae]